MYFIQFGLLILLVCGGCLMTAQQPQPQPEGSPTYGPVVQQTPAPQVTPTATASTPWTDENAHVRGVCFEAAWDAAEQIFTIRSAEDHIRFYDQVDNSQLCRRPIAREPRDFSDGYVIAGFWNRGMGCKADHIVTRYNRDDDARRILFVVTFATLGECNYELVRPFWVGLEAAADYEITFVVSTPEPDG